MSAIQEIFCKHGPEYLDRYGESMPASHKKVLHAVMKCRKGDFGTHLYDCRHCGQSHVAPCSCGNRHCPNCQHEKGAEWLHRQTHNLLPCLYFLITFTIPQELRRLVRTHQEVCYRAMFDAAAGALKKLALDKRFVGARQTGFLGVLHTWGRQLQYHPHLHFVVPGGGLSGEGKGWVSSRADLFVHVKPLSVIYRAKFRDAMEQAGLLSEIDPAVWEKDWVVNSQLVGSGKPTLKYLSAYVFRVALSNSRIVSVTDAEVTFKYRDSQTKRERKTTLGVLEFIRRFLQHALPRGLMKVRHYGFLSPNAKTPMEKIREMICVLYEIVAEVVEPLAKLVRKPLMCPKCGHPLQWSRFMPPVLPSG